MKRSTDQRPQDEAAPAFYPEKQAWKELAGNRYTLEELRQMERNWEIKLKNQDRPEVRSGD